jgi:cytochrome c-type biogenesis protein CcmH/NrfF
MSVLWVLPLVIVAGGLVAVFAATQRAAQAAGELRASAGDLHEVRTAFSDLAADAATTRESVERMRTRSIPVDESR